MLRVLIVTPEFSGGGGGIATYYRSLCSSLRSAGAIVDVIEGSAFVRSVDRSSRLAVDGIEVFQLLSRDWERVAAGFSRFAAAPTLRSHLSAAWAMAEAVSFGDGYDVVEASDWGLLFVPFVVAGRVPVIVQCHGSIGQIMRRDPSLGEIVPDTLTAFIESNMLCYAAGLQTPSAANAEEWRSVTGQDVAVMYPPFESSPIGRCISAGANGVVIGRMQRWKGPQVLAEALERLGVAAPDIDWYGRDVGWGEMQQATSVYLATRHPSVFGTRLRHRPPVSPIEASRLQASAGFNIVPSDWDVFNFTAVEAMASGRPTIVSRGAGASELVVDGVNGFTFPTGDAAALADTLKRVMRLSSAESAMIGTAARETVAQALDPTRIAAERLHAYRSVAKDWDGTAKRVPKPLAELLSPAAAGSYRHKDAFLEAYPMRLLARHLAARLTRLLVGGR